MKFELDFFEDFIQRELNTGNSVHRTVKDFTNKVKDINNEVERIKKGFRSHLFNLENESRFEVLIQHHQTHIISLADQVLQLIDTDAIWDYEVITADHTTLNLCKVLLSALKDLLSFIETYFSKYFNLDSTLPICYAIISAQEVIATVDVLKSIAVPEKIDSSLLDIILFPVIEFSQHCERTKATFRRLIFIKILLKELFLLLQSETPSPIDVYRKMCYLNFNSYYYLAYVIKGISLEVQELPTVADQLDRLSYLRKELNQLQVKPGVALKPDRATIQDQIATWLTEEIYYTEKKQQLTLMMTPGKYVEGSGQQSKINTTLSVTQLACYIRLMVEADVITNKNQIELSKFFSRHFSSMKNENISADSLRKKYHNIEKSSVTAVQKMLMTLLEHSKKLS